jgi:hypothetical protein
MNGSMKLLRTGMKLPGHVQKIFTNRNQMKVPSWEGCRDGFFTFMLLCELLLLTIPASEARRKSFLKRDPGQAGMKNDKQLCDLI